MTAEFCKTFSTDPSSTLPIGLHGDGAPFQAKMRDSLEQFSWNLPAHPQSTRIVFTAIPKKFVAPGTYNALLDVFSWSMQIMMEGVMPARRHDGTAFDSSAKGAHDSAFRIEAAGSEISLRMFSTDSRRLGLLQFGVLLSVMVEREDLLALQGHKKPRLSYGFPWLQLEILSVFGRGI